VPTLAPRPDGTVQAAFSGAYPRRCGERAVNVAVLDHSAFFARGFMALWRQAGGAWRGQLREGATPAQARRVATHYGPPLAEIVHDINKFSNNVMARNLFLTIGAVVDQPPATTARAAQVIERWLAAAHLLGDGLVLDNGAGLSHTSRISAQSLAALLQAAYKSQVAQPFIESLPIVGVDGTMRARLTNKPVLGNAYIKTGTLDGVRAIAGYVTAASGTSYAVVSFINHPRAEAARGALDRLLEWVYQHAPAVAPSPEAQPRAVQLTSNQHHSN
jgi:D-alanyl-D-alanine carboxypeptidase/D-alanyl-D-alanine-endopeptidase (penicillin-binding protein 4)